MTIEELLNEYQKLAKYCYNVDFADKKAVKKNNDSVDRTYQIIEIIKSEFGNEGISELKKLLDTSEFDINLWVATDLLEKFSLDKETERKALDIIEKVAAGDDVLALGYQHWIKDWKLKKGE